MAQFFQHSAWVTRRLGSVACSFCGPLPLLNVIVKVGTALSDLSAALERRAVMRIHNKRPSQVCRFHKKNQENLFAGGKVFVWNRLIDPKDCS